VGLYRQRTDHGGRVLTERGRWMPPTFEPIGSETGPFDYWAEESDFSGRSARMLYFNATFERPGEYPIRMRISASALYEADFDVDAIIRVELADQDGDVERVSDAIAAGEQLRRQLETAQPGWSRPEPEVAAFYLKAHSAIPDDLPEGTALLNVPTSHEGSKVGADYLLSLVEQNLAVLYEVRRQLGRRRDTRTAASWMAEASTGRAHRLPAAPSQDN
jgi:hypothetical protein